MESRHSIYNLVQSTKTKIMNTEGKPLSKDEIYKKHNIIIEGGGAFLDDILDEYAEIDSIGFAEWCAKEKYIYRYPSIELWISMKSKTHLTTAQLYQLYKKQQP